MKLKWLEIERFRTVKPGTRLVFDDGINVVLGKNGTGKTTLLNLISALVTGNLQPYEREALDVRFSVVTGEREVVVRWVNLLNEMAAATMGTRTDWSFEARIDADDGINLVISIDGSSAKLKSADDVFFVRPVNPYSVGLYRAVNWVVLSANETRPVGHVIREIMLLVQGRGCHRFDEALVLFDRFFNPEGSGFDGPGATATEVNSELSQRLAVWFPDPLTKARWTSEMIEVESRSSGWLDRAARLLDVDSVLMRIGRTSAEPLPDGGRIIHYDRIEFDITFPDGRLINHHMLSYGQKRLLTFLFYLYSVEGPIIADELVNGMHHAWVEACVDLLRERNAQAFLSSQNPLLLDELEFANAAAAQRTFIVAELEGGQFRWRQFSDDEARRFFAAYETGIQHVGEVLLTAGLW